MGANHQVSQTSEKLAPGSKLVTSIGTAIGTLELRRTAGTFELCIASAFVARSRYRSARSRRAPCINYVTAKFIKEG
jgi:hypothetical protein